MGIGITNIEKRRKYDVVERKKPRANIFVCLRICVWILPSTKVTLAKSPKECR